MLILQNRLVLEILVKTECPKLVFTRSYDYSSYRKELVVTNRLRNIVVIKLGCCLRVLRNCDMVGTFTTNTTTF